MNFRICILSYNHPQITARCVKSVLKLAIPSRVCLVHNGSEKKHSDALKNEFPDIEHLVMPLNKGFSGGANFGLRHLFEFSDWVFFITNDCQLIKTKDYVTGSAPGLYAPTVYYKETSKIDSLGAAVRLKDGHLHHLKSKNRNLTEEERFYVPGTAFLMHKNVFHQLQGFDEAFHTYWEDVDLSVRAQLAGFHVGLTEFAELSHSVGKTCHKKKFYTNFLFKRNKQLFLEKARRLL